MKNCAVNRWVKNFDPCQYPNRLYCIDGRWTIHVMFNLSQFTDNLFSCVHPKRKMSLAELRGALGVIGITGITGITRVTNTFSLTRAHTKQVELHPQEESTDPKAGGNGSFFYLLTAISSAQSKWKTPEFPEDDWKMLENDGKTTLLP